STKLRKRCWCLCLESTPMVNTVSMLSLASGIPRQDLVSMKVAPLNFGALNNGAAALCEADCRFSSIAPADLASFVSLAKLLKRKEGVEVLFIDSLQRIEFEPGKVPSPTEQRWISQVIRAVAHAGELTVVAGFNRPGVPFPDLASDST